MVNLCALWDHNYRDRGQALINSLVRHYGDDFRLWVLTFEEGEFLRLAKQRNVVTPVYMKYINDERPRLNRTHQEYLWTCAPYFTHYVMEIYRLDNLTYIDADCYLFRSLDPLFEEIGDADIAITSHRFTPSLREKLIGAGEYNVGFVYFSRGGMKCLKEWRDQCLEWCYNRIEDGKYGDQGYLNSWPDKYGVHVIRHVGANLAPWNQLQYGYRRLNILHSEDGIDVKISPVLFYHFHGLGRNDYEIHPAVAEHIYKPYIKELEWIKSQLQ